MQPQFMWIYSYPIDEYRCIFLYHWRYHHHGRFHERHVCITGTGIGIIQASRTADKRIAFAFSIMHMNRSYAMKAKQSRTLIRMYKCGQMIHTSINRSCRSKEAKIGNRRGTNRKQIPSICRIYPYKVQGIDMTARCNSSRTSTICNNDSLIAYRNRAESNGELYSILSFVSYTTLQCLLQCMEIIQSRTLWGNRITLIYKICVRPFINYSGTSKIIIDLWGCNRWRCRRNMLGPTKNLSKL